MKKNLKEHVYLDCILLCLMILFVSLVLKLLGSNDFDMPMIDSELNNNKILEIIVYLILYNINGLMILNIIIKRKFKKIEYLISILGITLMYFIDAMINMGYFYFLIDICILSILVLTFTKEPMLFIETIIVYGLNLLYQYLSLIIKDLNIVVASELFTTSIIFQLDYYMLLIITLLYFKRKGVNIYELVFKFIRWNVETFILLLTKRGSKEKRIQQNEKVVPKKQVEIGYSIYCFLLSLFQIVLVGTACYFVKNTIFNFIFIFVSFIVLRATFGKSYHADTVLKCTTLSMLTFVLATKLSLNIDLSLFSSVFVGLILAFFFHSTYYYQYFIKAKSDITKLDLEDLKITLNYLTETEVNMLYDYWHRDNNTSVDDIALKYGYNSKKIYRTIKKIKVD